MSDAKEELDKTKVSFKNKWEYIGYHKVLGGFYYQIIFFVLGIAYVMLLPIFVPFPESMGYYNILTGIFSSVFTFADMGTAGALSRFVAEHRVKDPERTIQYIRFFIWFQSFTGLGQTTAVSLIGLIGLKGTDLSFMPWMFIWLSIIQFPGYLGVFTEALKGFQHYAKVSLIGLLNMVFFQSVTLILGAQLGSYLGGLNPEVGNILGAAIGMVIGYYVDDFSSLVISGWMFSKLIKPMGYTLKDVFKPEISKDVAIGSLKFGMGIMVFVLSYQIPGTIVSFIYANPDMVFIVRGDPAKHRIM
ncbi:MAG: lipopolysaccharide biosynthesis protein, partial [Candidatus Hodarchaeota archaeon]